MAELLLQRLLAQGLSPLASKPGMWSFMDFFPHAGVLISLNYRPELTWRDVQHICPRTAQHINPGDPDWETTTSGRPYSYKYGYGALDAWTFVELAKTWKLVKKQAWVDLPQISLNNA